MAYTDYHKASGDGTLKIRDYGTKVEFWVQAGYSNFYWGDLSFSWTANGSTTYKDYDYPLGGDWEYLGYRNVTETTTVTFKLLESTGTSSLAGPTTHSVTLNRDTVPQAPDVPVASAITSTSATLTFTDNGNGGDAIDTRQLAYRIGVPTGTLYSLTSDGSTSVTGLTPGTKYYFWARVHNSEGWSGYSASMNFTTLNVPGTPAPPVISAVTQDSVHAVFVAPATGGTAILENQIGYGLDPVAPTDFVSSLNTDILALDPGMQYYFWARSRNSVGWGAWSGVTAQQLIAGAMVKVGLVHKRAVPYVNDEGVWKLAISYGKLAGVWKQST